MWWCCYLCETSNDVSKASQKFHKLLLSIVISRGLITGWTFAETRRRHERLRDTMPDIIANLRIDGGLLDPPRSTPQPICNIYMSRPTHAAFRNVESADLLIEKFSERGDFRCLRRPCLSSRLDRTRQI